MRKNWTVNLFTWVAVVILLLSACNRKDAHTHNDTYTCPMHPTVVSAKQGTCPVCGMDLVRQARAGEELKITGELNNNLKSPNEVVLTNIRTIQPVYKSSDITIEADGIVTYDPRKINVLSTRVGGKLERVLLKYPFQRVEKGQMIAEIYSPELVTAQRELLFLLANDPDNVSLIDGAKQRLSVMGLTTAQINTIANKREPQQLFRVFSNYSGYVITEDLPSTTLPTRSLSGTSASTMNEGMGGSSSNATSSTRMIVSNQTTALLREGSYISAGETLFRIVNTNAILIELKITAEQGEGISKGSKIEVSVGHEDKLTATIDFIEPFMVEGESFVTLRAYVNNNLPIGHLVKATLQLETEEGLWLPKEAVLDRGLEKIVFVKERDAFRARKIVLGNSTFNEVMVKEGITSGDLLAANAKFMIDSESFIKTMP